MSTEAILIMILAIVVIWGGLIAAMVNLNRSTPPKLDEIRRDL